MSRRSCLGPSSDTGPDQQNLCWNIGTLEPTTGRKGLPRIGRRDERKALVLGGSITPPPSPCLSGKQLPSAVHCEWGNRSITLILLHILPSCAVLVPHPRPAPCLPTTCRLCEACLTQPGVGYGGRTRSQEPSWLGQYPSPSWAPC
jgi:hypothetical protein